MTHPINRLALMLLCLLLAAAPALGEEGEAALKIVPPAYPTPDYVEWLLEIAQGEIGYQEERNGNTKYGMWAGNPSAEWCAEFLCWCVNQADKIYDVKMLNQIYPNYTGTNTGRNWFLKQGRYIARRGTVPSWGSQWYKGENEAILPNSYIPQPGDWVFFSNNALGDTTHVAMVEYCAYNEEGKLQVHVIEGNNPQAVARNAYDIDYWAILGYGTVHDLADIVLRTGNEGLKVSALQQALVDTGYLGSQYVTGKYASLTTQAVKDFQKAQGLEVTGVANHATQTALFRLADEMRASQPEAWAVEEELP